MKVIPLHTLTAVNTADLGAREFRSTIPASLDAGPDTIPTMPAEACTKVGHIHYPPRSTASLWVRLRRWWSVVRWRYFN